MKPKAIYIGWSNHDCSAYYRCPVCDKIFDDWLMKTVKDETGTHDYCPFCKTELDV
jgi:uncharacterized C2H2 Zn-finger protein